MTRRAFLGKRCSVAGPHMKNDLGVQRRAVRLLLVKRCAGIFFPVKRYAVAQTSSSQTHCCYSNMFYSNATLRSSSQTLSGCSNIKHYSQVARRCRGEARRRTVLVKRCDHSSQTLTKRAPPRWPGGAEEKPVALLSTRDAAQLQKSFGQSQCVALGPLFSPDLYRTRIMSTEQ